MYFGPETYLPLASVVAGATGLILTFWRRLTGFVRKLFRRDTSKADEGRTPSPVKASGSTQRSRKRRRRSS